jgi:hypothetical protein
MLAMQCPQRSHCRSAMPPKVRHNLLLSQPPASSPMSRDLHEVVRKVQGPNAHEPIIGASDRQTTAHIDAVNGGRMQLEDAQQSPAASCHFVAGMAMLESSAMHAITLC